MPGTAATLGRRWRRAGRRLVRRVQHFEITIGTSATSATATISPVNTRSSVILFGGFTTTHSGSPYREMVPRVELTNGNTVTAYRDTASATFTTTVRGCVVEFEPWAVQSLQQGTVTVAASATTGTATIAAVDPARAALFYLGFTPSTAVTSPNQAFARIDLTDATTVTANRGTAGTSVLTVGYCVVEFAPGVLASVQQRAAASTSNTLTYTDAVTAVSPANTLLLYNGVSSTSTSINIFQYNLELTAANTVTLTRLSNSSTSRTVNYTALEFAPGFLVRVQRGQVSVSSATSADATVLNVSPAKAACNVTNFATIGGSNAERFASGKLLSATTVRGEKNTAGSTESKPGYEVAEFA